VKNKLLNIPPIPAVLLAIISVQSGAAIAKVFPAIGAAGTASRMEFQLSYSSPFTDLIYSRLPLSNGKL
jgi:threonine/homoserine efflux transporter RhtA